MKQPTDKHGRECKPWNKVVVPEYKCLNCEHYGRGCQKHEHKRRGWLV